MAGPATVFLPTEFEKASAVERDGFLWKTQELHFAKLPEKHHRKPMLQTVLTLKGLKESTSQKMATYRASIPLEAISFTSS